MSDYFIVKQPLPFLTAVRNGNGYKTGGDLLGTAKSEISGNVIFTSATLEYPEKFMPAVAGLARITG
jgi:hypothetical protein